ncbi:MAG: hypothetical protein ACJAVR_002600 [Paracoccaceae bacterium]|jgi:hypothetical protein
MKFRSFAAYLLFLTSACTNSAGIAEFTAYRDGFHETRASASALFDLVEVAERRSIEKFSGIQTRLREKQRADGEEMPNFVVADARYYSTVSPPPMTTAYRRSVDLVTEYNTVMTGLATGQRGTELSADAASLARRASGLAATIGGSGILTEPAVEALAVLAGIALEYRSRQVFLNELQKTTPVIQTMLRSMIDNSPKMFDHLSQPPGQMSEPEVEARREQVRVLISDFVVLMQHNSEALDVAGKAAATGGSQLSLEALDAIIADAVKAAKAVRTGVAEFAVN